MTVRVVDASALILQVAPASGAAVLPGRLSDTFCHAPHLIDAECGHVLRRAARSHALTVAQAWTALRAAGALIDVRHAHPPLRQIAWSLRDRLSFYDAIYVALAVRLDIPLITADRRLANAAGLPCAVELAG